MADERCPFKVGDTVVYAPGKRGRDLLVMTKLSALVPGKRYKVVQIKDEQYVVVEGFETVAEGGLFWTEFSAD